MKAILLLILLVTLLTGRVPASEKEDATQRYAHLFSKYELVVLADVYCDDQFVYAKPREVWKDSGMPVTGRITFPRHEHDSFNPDLKPCLAVIWFTPHSKNKPWGVAFSDGVYVGGPDGATIAGLRAFFKKEPNQPPEPTPPSGVADR